MTALGMGERPSAVDQSLATAQKACSEYQRRNRQLAWETAQEVVAAGGVTDQEVFLFAMHGILSGFTRQPDTHEQSIIDEYSRLEARFQGVAAATPIVEIDSAYDKATLQCAALVQMPKESGSPLRYSIEESGTGYAGSVELPLTNVHRWYFNTPADQPELVEDASVFRLAHMGGYRGAPLDVFDKNFAVGLKEIFAARQFEQDLITPEDQRYLDRVQTFLGSVPR